MEQKKHNFNIADSIAGAPIALVVGVGGWR